MKSYRKELWFNVPSRRGFINITPQVEDCLRESGIREGLALINAMHITASVLTTMTRADCITTTRSGSRTWRRTNPSPSTITTELERTTLTRISSVR